MDSNNVLLYQGYEILGQGLGPFVRSGLQKHLGKDWQNVLVRENPRYSSLSLDDPRAQLRILLDFWTLAFKKLMVEGASVKTRTPFKELFAAREHLERLQQGGNAVAHHNNLDSTQTLTLLYTMQQVLVAVGAKVEAEQISPLLTEAKKRIAEEIVIVPPVPPVPPTGATQETDGGDQGGVERGEIPETTETVVSKGQREWREVEISQSNPGHFVFLIDQSGSMLEPIAGSNKSKADAVSDAINGLFYNLIIRCAQGPKVRDYFYITCISYGDSIANALGEIFGHKTIEPVTVSQLADNPLEIEHAQERDEDAPGDAYEAAAPVPVWLRPGVQHRQATTPMCAALRAAKDLVADWISKHPNSAPPVVINLTDGVSTDGDPLPPAKELTSLHTSGGNVLLFNAHISRHGNVEPSLYPDSDAHLPTPQSKTLFAMSSPIPPDLRAVARELGYPVQEGSRGFAFNADLRSVVEFLQIASGSSARI